MTELLIGFGDNQWEATRGQREELIHNMRAWYPDKTEAQCFEMLGAMRRQTATESCWEPTAAMTSAILALTMRATIHYVRSWARTVLRSAPERSWAAHLFAGGREAARAGPRRTDRSDAESPCGRPRPSTMPSSPSRSCRASLSASGATARAFVTSNRARQPGRSTSGRRAAHQRKLLWRSSFVSVETPM